MCFGLLVSFVENYELPKILRSSTVKSSVLNKMSVSLSKTQRTSCSKGFKECRRQRKSRKFIKCCLLANAYMN